jgi:hypothetical protein
MLVPILGGLAIAVGLLGYADSKEHEATPSGDGKPKPKAKSKAKSKSDDKESADSAYARGVAEADAKAKAERTAADKFDDAVSKAVEKQMDAAKKLAGVE